MLFNCATLSYYDPTYLTEKGGATGPPRWLFFTCVLNFLSSRRSVVDMVCTCRWGIGLFMYQTLDAIDGWVARIGIGTGC